MSAAFLGTNTSCPALSRPPIAPASAGAEKPLRLARRIGAGLKPSHGEIAIDFNYIKYFFQTVFPCQNQFLYWPNDPWRTHAPDFSRRRSGAFARAKNAVRGQRSKKFSKTDEQFCCRSSARTEPRQPQRRGRPATQSQCHATRQAFGRATRPSRRSQIDDPLCERALRAGSSLAQSAPGVST
jgi:hypothetical protein